MIFTIVGFIIPMSITGCCRNDKTKKVRSSIAYNSVAIVEVGEYPDLEFFNCGNKVKVVAKKGNYYIVNLLCEKHADKKFEIWARYLKPSKEFPESDEEF